MIRTDDGYRFTNAAWARYTGNQIVCAAVIAFGLLAAVWGFSALLGGLNQLIVSTENGVLIASDADLGIGFFVGWLVAMVGFHAASVAAKFWPHPRHYALPIEVEGYFTCGGVRGDE